MKDFKRKQHYIWKYYLRAWTKDEQILCKRFDKIFKSALENLGQSHFFYESIALNDSELEHLMAFFRVAHPTAQQNLTALLNLYIKSSTGDDYLQKCGIEEFHAIVENKAIAILKMLYKHDLSFFQNDEYRNNFSFFLGCQYTRTRKMRDNLSKMPLNISPNISKEKIGNIYSLFFGDIIGNWIYSRSKLKLFINNNDNCSFITADQPVINTNLTDDIYNESKNLNYIIRYLPHLLSTSAKTMKELNE